MIKFNLILLCLITKHFFCTADKLNNFDKEMGFGGWSISKQLYDYILTILEPGKTILELGSGSGSEELAKVFEVFSIEHDKTWLNKYPVNYIYAPIVDGWYDLEILKEQIPEKYDLIIVDGPTGTIGRYGFFSNLELFNTDLPIIIDDVNRAEEFRLMNDTANYLKRKPVVLNAEGKKQFGIILPNTNN